MVGVRFCTLLIDFTPMQYLTPTITLPLDGEGIEKHITLKALNTLTPNTHALTLTLGSANRYKTSVTRFTNT